jgi:hypothetical protein
MDEINRKYRLQRAIPGRWQVRSLSGRERTACQVRG